jgi:hypothetical protein
MARYAFLIVSLWIMTDSMAEAACVVPRFPFHVNQTSDAYMHVTKGSSCSIIVHAGGRSSFSGISISTRPRNGEAGTRSVGVSYRPKPGFVGNDTFTFAVSGQFASGTGTAIIRVNVTVE